MDTIRQDDFIYFFYQPIKYNVNLVNSKTL